MSQSHTPAPPQLPDEQLATNPQLCVCGHSKSEHITGHRADEVFCVRKDKDTCDCNCREFKLKAR